MQEKENSWTKEKQKSYYKVWREKNKSKVAQYQKKWHKENKEKIKGYSKKLRDKMFADATREEVERIRKQEREKTKKNQAKTKEAVFSAYGGYKCACCLLEPKTEKEKNAMRGPRPHVNQALSKNNNAKKIKTPFGIFDSIKEASLILNMKYDNLWYKLRAKHSGWEYVV